MLNLVEKLSPLSLYMLGDYCNWPTFEMKSLVSVDDYVNAHLNPILWKLIEIRMVTLRKQLLKQQ